MSPIPSPVVIHGNNAEVVARRAVSCGKASPRKAPLQYRRLAFHGELDVSRRTEVERKLARIVEFGAVTTIIDLTDVQYLDTMFLNALLRARGGQAAGPFDGRVCVVASHPVSRLFAITGLEHVFPIFADFSSARRYARGTPMRPLADFTLITRS